MKLAFLGMSSTKGLKLYIDTDAKEYMWSYGYLGVDAFYMPTNKDLYALEKKLIKEGYEEIEGNNYGKTKGHTN